ncbi:DUF2235 domain-containing protein [Phaeovulum vinaykumarii]|uniref:Uncharacterized alpha/beta hydrolase domain n=1 Tax=Phaeovulum vinaykumarii TaxID=407234 RepID=A0A1N7M2S4_9RHOB|nr:DUF2235 domain-containing protein [Phaeovulum vinaykumarii]SIS80352.1 Uncharacterized alpha/beta hydrolase domain [Phaeovulum vinaykumarii]SOC09265.1 putative alpha/beta hydrolase family protein DUF2235 [Phaeovulum vinaykumarii]
MPRTIVLMLDGTSNEIAANRSNILRLYGTLEKTDRQVVWYDPGVGTLGPERAWLRARRKASEVFGMATGWGLDENVKEAYRFLSETWARDTTPENRDRIFLIGFSRGAYSARVLAGFIHAVGLIEPRNLNLLEYAYRAYKRIGETGRDSDFDEIRLYRRILRAEQPPIRALGLFDTVTSVIEQGRFGPRLRSHAFTSVNPSVEAVRQALALDERRTMYRPLRWPEGGLYQADRLDRAAAARPQDLREVWFAGVHSDVGGGYPEPEAQLAKLSLRWMVAELAALGLTFDADALRLIVEGQPPGQGHVAPDPAGDPHQSMKPLWRLLEYLPRKKPEGSTRPDLAGWVLPMCEPRPVPQGARIHRSALEHARLKGRAFPNLPADHRIEG